MAIPTVRKTRQENTRWVSGREVGPMEKAGAAIGAVGGLVSGNPLLAAGGLVGAAQAFREQPKVAQRFESEIGTSDFPVSAMERRSLLMQENPIDLLKDARQALHDAGIDPQTRAMLEAPILRALQSGTGRA